MPVTIQKLTIPTYTEPAPESLPMFAENRVHQRSSGNPYPNAVVNTTHDGIIADREYTAVVLENDSVAITVLPELGGRIFRAVDKRTGYDFFYRQSVIKPALIGALGSWISGGVEFNWPYHHRPSTFLPVDFTTETEPDGTVAVHLSEHDPFDRMKGMVTLRLPPDSIVLETAARIFNCTPTRHSFLWWENAAVPVHEDYHIFFPGDVQRVYFHYRRDTNTYPLGSGFYNGHDFGPETELTRHGNIRFATSLFSDASAYDFFGGYDKTKNCGVIHTANRHTSPGKKLFTWGYGQLSQAWEKALTDTDGAYAELMASSYSSNQPDFSWIEPYETKCFSQFWYPLAGTGIPFYADRNFILCSQDGNLLLSATSAKNKSVTVRLYQDGRLVHEADCTLNCRENTILTLHGIDPARCRIEIMEGSRRLLRYVPVEPVCAEASTIGDLLLPEETAAAEEAYRTGIHILQYRDPKADPAVYFRRALALDETHIPARLALAEICIHRKEFSQAETYLLQAEKLLTRWNRRPESGKVFYLLGYCAEAMERYSEAREWYWQAAVLSDTANCAYTRIAAMDGQLEDWDAMYADARYAASHFPDNLTARAYAAIAAIQLSDPQTAVQEVQAIRITDPLFHLANRLAVSLGLLSEEDFWAGLHSSPTQTCVDLYGEFCSVGLPEWGEQLLRECLSRGKADAIVSVLLGEAPTTAVGRTFPFRLIEKKALQKMHGNPDTDWLLGCLLYHDRQYAEAANLWKTVDTPAAMRNLAIWHWREDRQEESLRLLKEALEREASDQLLLEWANTANRCGMYDAVRERLSAETPAKLRDDILLEWIHACNKLHLPAEALDLLLQHRFVPCEGGESAVTSRYLEATHTIARDLYHAKQYEDALAAFENALILPENLGAGLWNDGPLAPSLYGKARTLIHLGHPEEADKTYRQILAMKVDFFSDMHQPLLPIWQACALRELGENEKAQRLYEETCAKLRLNIEKKDSGSFTTTPFFNCYIDPPAAARASHFTGLLQNAEEIFHTAFGD